MLALDKHEEVGAQGLKTRRHVDFVVTIQTRDRLKMLHLEVFQTYTLLS